MSQVVRGLPYGFFHLVEGEWLVAPGCFHAVRTHAAGRPETDAVSQQPELGSLSVKIVKVTANNRRKAFEIATRSEVFVFPYAQLRVRPTAEDHVVEVYADPELGREAFTYALEGGWEDSVHLDEVREHNRDPEMLGNLLLYRLTLEAQKRVAASDLRRCEGHADA